MICHITHLCDNIKKGHNPVIVGKWVYQTIMVDQERPLGPIAIIYMSVLAYLWAGGVLMKQAGNCSSCEKGIKLAVNNDVLCKIHGVVSKDFRCAKYVRRVEAWTAYERKPKCIECDFFVTSPDKPEKDPSIGYCRLFTVRYYDGSLKSACSKFSGKTARNIS